MNGKLAKERLQILLKSNTNAFIYHCYNHYCCPIGFEREPLNQNNIYDNEKNQNDDDDSNFIDWIFLADTSKKYSNFHCVKWEDIDKDLNSKSPEYINIRQLDKGVFTKNTQPDRNLHCLIRFENISNDEYSKESKNIAKNINPLEDESYEFDSKLYDEFED